MPVHVVYGDSFLVASALRELKQEVGPPEVWEANCHHIPADQASVASLKPVCDAVPFLAQMRLVIVEGLLATMETRDGSGQRRRAGGPGRAATNWDGLEAYLGAIPATTLLVFVDGALRRQNPLLERLRPLAQVREMATPSGEALSRWIRTIAASREAHINPGAIGLLSRLVGPNLWLLYNELEKLALYAAGAPISEVYVRELVPQAREATIFNVVDGVLEGRYATAFRAIVSLREGGAEFSYVIAMMARQLRQVLLARELLDGGCPQTEMGHKLHITARFALQKTVEQAKRHSRQGLVRLYEELLETDLAVKQGRMGEDLALQLFVRHAS